MTYCDFVVKYDPEKDDDSSISRKILYSVIIGRLKSNKPVTIFMGGESGEGKSISAIALQQIIMELQDQDIKEFLHDMNVYTPLEYPKKIQALLHDKKLKKANIICIHEAREVVNAKNWQSFLTQSIASVNAMSRSVKRLCIIIISQFIRDITNDIRYTLNYYIIVKRPKGKKARMYINTIWKDDRDIDNPKIRKGRLKGFLVYPNGMWRKFIPTYLEVTMPDKEIVKEFEQADKEAKSYIINKKMQKLMVQLEKEIGVESDKIDKMVDWYMNDTKNLDLIGKVKRNKWKLNADVAKMHNLTKEEIQIFEKKLNIKFKEKEILPHEPTESI